MTAADADAGRPGRTMGPAVSAPPRRVLLRRPPVTGGCAAAALRTTDAACCPRAQRRFGQLLTDLGCDVEAATAVDDREQASRLGSVVVSP